MKRKTKVGMLATAVSAGLMSISAFAGPQDVISDISNAAGKGDGSLSSINESINSFSGNIILFVLSTVTAVVLVGLAITLLMMALGGQREKENAKSKILTAIVLLVLATPAAFFGIAGLIGEQAESAGSKINGDGSGNSTQKIGGEAAPADKSSGFRITGDEPVYPLFFGSEYSVYL